MTGRRRVAVTSRLPGAAVAWLERAHEVRVHAGAPITGEDELVEFFADAEAALTLLRAGADRIGASASVAILTDGASD